jgi:hypothetical protein
MNNGQPTDRNWLWSFVEHVLKTPLLEVLCAVLVLLILHFLVQYLARGLKLRWMLVRFTKAVRDQQRSSATDVKANLAGVFNGSLLEFGWSEYEETLHEQSEWSGGERRAIAVRATVPSQTFINVETVIDPRLGAEYFKHLPGILTGMGIIGTFFGLIHGLTQFDPTVNNTDELKHGLGLLFGEVKFAFTFSGFAIGSAILITFIEKLIYSACAKWIGEITQALDGLFRAGVGEEYLSSLVQAAQESASQTRQLKESLVEELKVVLTNLADRQIAATQQMTVDFGVQIEKSFQQPLQSIAETVRMASGAQTEATGAVLENLMTAFMAQMREQVGGQMGDLGALLRQTATSMTQVEGSMRSLVEDMRTAGGDQRQAVTGVVQELLQKLEGHQQKQERAVAASSHVLMEKLHAAVGRMAEAQEEASRRTQESMAKSVGAIQGQVEGLAKSNAELLGASQDATLQMQQASAEAFGKLSAAAGNVERAVSGMAAVAEKMTTLAVRLTGLEAQVTETAKTSSQAATTLASASQSVAGATARLSETAARLEAVAKVTATEADTRAALLRDLKAASEFSSAAAREFVSLSEQVQSHLMKNVETFGAGVGATLGKHLSDYQKQLGDSVNMLRTALEELAEYADNGKGK